MEEIYGSGSKKFNSARSAVIAGREMDKKTAGDKL